MAVNGVREEGKDGTPAHTTPREIEKSQRGSFSRALSGLYCVYRRGDGMQWWRDGTGVLAQTLQE